MWMFDDPFAFVFLSSLFAAVASVIGFQIDRRRQEKTAGRKTAEHVSASGPFTEEKRKAKAEIFREKENMPAENEALEYVSSRGFEKGFEELSIWDSRQTIWNRLSRRREDGPE